jgi:hypothetical protein
VGWWVLRKEKKKKKRKREKEQSDGHTDKIAAVFVGLHPVLAAEHGW